MELASVGSTARRLPLPRGGEPDWSTGTIDSHRLIVAPRNERIERPYVLHVYSAKEWIEMLREAGFGEVDAFGAAGPRDADRT